MQREALATGTPERAGGVVCPRGSAGRVPSGEEVWAGVRGAGCASAWGVPGGRGRASLLSRKLVGSQTRWRRGEGQREAAHSSRARR